MINIKRKIINLLKIMTFSLIITQSLSFAASEDPLSITEQANKSQLVENIIDSQLRVETLEELQKDLSNRLILGVFGKDALVYSLGTNVSENVINEIMMLSMEDVQNHSTPFNIGNLNGLLMILSSFFFVAFSVLALYFAWVMFEGLFNTQDSGEFFGQKTSTLFSILKGSTAMILIIPAYGFSHKPFSDFQNSIDGTQYGSFSIVQLFVFKAMGYSNQFSNHIWGSFVNNYQKAFPTIALPNTYSKENEMKDFFNYVMCVKSYNSNEVSNLGFKRSKDNLGSYSVTSKFKECVFDGKIKYNLSTIEELKKESEFSTLVNSTVDYETLFVKTIDDNLRRIVNQSSNYADLILSESSALTDSVEKNGLLVNPTNWRNLCGTPELMFEKGKINTTSLPLLQYYMEKCLSESFVLSFISDDINVARKRYQTTVLSGYHTDLCDEDSALQNGKRTFVKTSDIGTSENGNSKTLQSCLVESCSAESGLYQCTSAIEFVKTNSENERMIKQGWLTAGAYSYALFSGFKNNAAQEIINSLSTSFYIRSGRNTIVDRNGDLNYQITSINLENKNISNDFQKTLKMNLGTDNILNAKKETVSMIMPSGGFAGANNPDGLFGIYKFVTCSGSPMSVTNGYSCGNITEEMHDIGAKMVSIAIEIKIASSVGQLLGFARVRDPSKNEAVMNSTGKISKFLGKAANAYTPILKIIGYGGAGALAGSTAFSTIDSYWIQNPETYIALIALVSGQVPFMSGIMDFTFGILFLVGLIFGFILPLLPYFLWLTVISGWAIMILESLIVAPVWAATLISPSNDHTSRTAKKGMLIIMTILMRAPFMVIGLVLAWLLSNTLIGSLLEIANIHEALLLTNASSIAGFIDTFVKLIVYFSLVYFIYNLVFSIIEGFYEIGSNWLFGSSLSPFATKDRSERWRRGFSSAKSFVGVKK